VNGLASLGSSKRVALVAGGHTTMTAACAAAYRRRKVHGASGCPAAAIMYVPGRLVGCHDRGAAVAGQG